MTVKRRLSLFTLASFVLAEIILGILVQTTAGDVNARVCYSAVMLASAFALFSLTPALDVRGDWLIALGFIFTLFADWFLVIENPIKPLTAMIFFNGTQLSYAAAIYRRQKGAQAKQGHILARVGASLLGVVITFAILGDTADALSVISVVYYLNLLLNAAFAFTLGKRGLLLAFGLVCFALCDVFVGLDNLDMYFEITKGSLIWMLTHTGVNMAWVFYVPSQTMIAINDGFFKTEP